MQKIVSLVLILAVGAYAEDIIASVSLAPDVKEAAKTQNVSGVLRLVQTEDDGPVTITGKISNLMPDALHGFHVHAKGDLSQGCSSAGAHFNPEKSNHGAPNATERHIGDLGNIKADSNGVAEVNITDSKISLTGKNSIIGRAIVVHSGKDDLGLGGNNASLQTGNAGDRWACGVIGIV
ncbi:hypothetical protein QAD02_022212 [Eretmocerus hayati]|uniref:Uncharacterized protein n=1 Tax=Eretmocerus hayati TaxID=131215 RepID=A0ACC2PTF8_9HYME|nr:hypothetical protein QAD02_022212 [Eretmocerus hayati]